MFVIESGSMRMSTRYGQGYRTWICQCIAFGVALSLSTSLPASTAAIQNHDSSERAINITSVHVIVRDARQFKTLAQDIIGARLSDSRLHDSLDIPGLRIDVEEGHPGGASDGSSINHIGLWIKDYERTKAGVVASHLDIVSDSYDAGQCAAAPGTPACQFMVTFPDGVRVEFTEDQRLATTAASHHIHLQVDDPESVRAWYSKTFGGNAYLRRGMIVALKLGSNEFDFTKASLPQVGSKGRAIDHVGVEVADLDGFWRKLDREDIKCEAPFAPGRRLASAFITDPAGVRIELRERLK
jgi:catechol 2,3-dioxygenase-like lactoylglutathione lyase family enzyme